MGDRGAVDPTDAAATAGRWPATGGRPGGVRRDRVRHAGGLLVVEAARGAVRGDWATAHRWFTQWSRPGSGCGCMRRCWTDSASRAVSTGPGRWSTRSVSWRKRGRSDRPEPGRSRQARQETARHLRPGRPAAGGAGHRRQRPRQPAAAAHARLHPRHSHPGPATSVAAGQAARSLMADS